MTRRHAHIAPCLAAGFAAALALAGSRPAHADSAQLHWEYQCLKDPDAVCFDTTPSGDDPLAPKPAPIAAPSAAPGEDGGASSSAAVAPSSAKPAKQAAKPGPAAVADMLGTIAGRLRVGKPTPSDMSVLEARARQGQCPGARASRLGRARRKRRAARSRAGLFSLRHGGRRRAADRAPGSGIDLLQLADQRAAPADSPH
jgi:hypothetical protein